MRLHPHNVVDLNADSSRCGICNTSSTTFYYTDTGLKCERCQMKKDPPVIKLLYTERDVLYDTKRSNYLHQMTIDMLKNCGWFLRRIRIFNELEEYIFRGDLTLEYTGLVKCRLAEDYPLWPMSARKCPRELCNLIAPNNFYM